MHCHTRTILRLATLDLLEGFPLLFSANVHFLYVMFLASVIESYLTQAAVFFVAMWSGHQTSPSVCGIVLLHLFLFNKCKCCNPGPLQLFVGSVTNPNLFLLLCLCGITVRFACPIEQSQERDDAAQREQQKESGARLHFCLFFTQRRKGGGCVRVAGGGCGYGGVLVLIYPRGQYSGIPRLTLSLGTLVVLVNFQLLLSAKVQSLHFDSLASA